jgi:hypothetical protein
MAGSLVLNYEERGDYMSGTRIKLTAMSSKAG